MTSSIHPRSDQQSTQPIKTDSHKCYMSLFDGDPLAAIEEREHTRDHLLALLRAYDQCIAHRFGPSALDIIHHEANLHLPQWLQRFKDDPQEQDRAFAQYTSVGVQAPPISS